jgi:DNA-directed RNA polymerase specialized sigma24 family protein
MLSRALQMPPTMSRFRTTRWSLVIDARSGSLKANRALDELCRVYRPPVLAYLRRHGPAEADAEDLTQAFFEQLLRLRTHAVADPERGRFRVFLLVALKRFLSNQSAFAQAAKRGGGSTTLSLDDEERVGQPADPATPEGAFERAWATVIVQQAAAQLQREASGAGKLELFQALRPFLLESPDPEEYARIAERLSMRRNTLAVAIHRLRQRLRELVREEMADTVTEADQLEDEMSTLQQALETPKGELQAGL